MARIRSIKPSIWTDERFIELSRDARLLFIGMVSHSDDAGRIVASGAALIGAVFPHDDLTPKQVEKWRDEIGKTGLILIYEAGRGTYAALPGWRRHQRIQKPQPSTLPPPPVTDSVQDQSRTQSRTQSTTEEEKEWEKEEEREREVTRSTTDVATGEPPPTRAHTADVLLAEHLDRLGGTQPRSVVNKTRTAVLALLEQDIDPARISAGLARMRHKKLGLHLLDQLVAEATAPAEPTQDPRFAGLLADARSSA